MKPITTRELHIYAKRGETLSSVMRMHDCSQKELFQMIQKLVNQKVANRIIKEFKNNSKKAQKLVDSKPRNTELKECTINPTPVYQVMQDIQNPNVEQTVKKITPSPTLTLPQLEEDERYLSEECILHEKNHKEIMRQRKNIVSELAQSKKTLFEIQQQLKNEQEKVIVLSEEYNQLAHKMSCEQVEINTCKELLSDIRSQIGALKKVCILVYTDGTIDVENAKLPVFSQEAQNSLLAILIQKPDAEDLTIKQLKCIANVYLMAKQYKSEGLVVEIVFEASQVQEFYSQI